MASTGPLPIPLIAPRPKRMAPAVLTEKVKPDSLISGPNTSIPIRRHSSMKNDTCLISDMLLLKTEAMYSAG